MVNADSYARPDTINALVRRINSFADGYRQNIAIIGEPYIGKTSLVKTILSSEELKRDQIIPIYLEIKLEPFEFCAKRFIKSALHQLLQSDPFLTAPHDTVLLIEDLKRNYPKTAQTCLRVLQDLEKGKLEEAYSFMMDIPATIFEESKKRCVLILDEFHNLANFNLKHSFTILAKKIMIQKDTMCLLISSRDTLSQRILNEKLAMLFGNFERIILPPFDIDMSRAFLQDNIKGTIFPPAYLDFIASLVGNKPLYMRIISDEIERAVFSKRVEPHDYRGLIEYSLAETVFKETGVINQLFLALFSKISEGKLLSRSASVLIALSCENKKQYDITKASGLQARDVSKILNRLTEMDIIVRNGSFYRFKERLFNFWLHSVYMKKLLSFSIDGGMEKDRFRMEVGSNLEFFIREFEKELSLRIEDLFRSFKNDIIQLNGKKHKFFSFDEVGRIEENFCSNMNILARNTKSRWLCMIKKEYMTENDILVIIKNVKSKKWDKRISRNIVVPLAGINENAYLLAKESKFWVWDVKSLNILMELYGKPCILS